MEINTVSLCVVALNEERFLPSLLNDFLNQSYDKKNTEIILIDSGSKDKTKMIMTEFMNRYKSTYYGIQVLDNLGKIQASGWNVAINNFKTEVLIRIDAHTSVPQFFVEKNMKNINKGEYVVGGKRPCLIENKTEWAELLLQVENSLFGSSINISRRSDKPQYVKTLFHGCYRREVFERVGMFNEKLLRTEDNEMHYRIRNAGYKIYYDPEVISYQYARSDLKSMVKQKFNNGLWIGYTFFLCPRCLSIFYFMPMCFLIGIIVTSIFFTLGYKVLFTLMWCSYFLFVLLGTCLNIIQNGFSFIKLLMPFLYFILHVSYGVGTVWSFIKAPFIIRKMK